MTDSSATTGAGGRTVGSVKRLFAVVDALVELDGARVTELADHLGMAKSSVHAYLTTMVEDGYATKEGDRYYAGLRFLTVGSKVRERKRVFRLARPIVEDLARQTDERAQFIVAENDRGVFVHRATGERAVDAGTHVGKRIFLHATGAGKVILAYLPAQERDAILDRTGLPARTENTITDRAALETALDTIREQGYAVNDEEGTSGLRTVAAPVFGPSGELLGALSVSGPSRRLREAQTTHELAEMIRGSANELELRLTYD
jgi:DNA-binding IclR family transcriptional regulator